MNVSLDTLIKRSVGNMGEVHPLVKEYAIALLKRAYDEDIYVQISSGYRSHLSQAALYGQGRSSYKYKGKEYGRIKDENGKQLKIVTNAEPGESIHNYGLAIDYFLVTKDGEDAIWDANKEWRRVAEIAKGMGFEWGGDWNSFKDYPHLQYTRGLTLNQLAAGKRPAFPILLKEVDTAREKPVFVNKEVVHMLNPSSKALKNGTVVALQNAFKEGILSSEDWAKKASEGTLPLDDAIALSFLLADGKKRA